LNKCGFVGDAGNAGAACAACAANTNRLPITPSILTYRFVAGLYIFFVRSGVFLISSLVYIDKLK